MNSMPALNIAKALSVCAIQTDESWIVIRVIREARIPVESE